jgi:hypothetical protein
VNLAYECKYEKKYGRIYNSQIQIINENDKLYTNNKRLRGLYSKMGKILSLVGGLSNH